MVGYADELLQFQIFDPGLLLHFAEGCHFYWLSWILMPFRQIPEPVSADQEVVSASVGHKPAPCIDLLELGTDSAVGILDVRSRYADALQ